MFFTIKNDFASEKNDNQSLVMIRLSNPGDENDGLLYLNESVASDSELGSITMTDAATGQLTITLKASATIQIPDSDNRVYRWDCKFLKDGGSAPVTNVGGMWSVSRPVTQATS